MESPHVKGTRPILDSGFQIFVSGTWIEDSNRQWDSRFLELYSGFQKPRIPNSISKKISRVPESGLDSGFQSSVGFRIPRALFRIPYSELQSPGLQVPQAKISRVPEFRISLQGRLGMKARRGERPVPSPTDVPKLLPVVHL